MQNGKWLSIFSEATGFKSGVALNKAHLLDLLPGGSPFKDFFAQDNDIHIRIHSSDIDDIFAQILYALGNIPEPRAGLGIPRAFNKYRGDEKLSSIHNGVMDLWVHDHWPKALEKAQLAKNKDINPEPFFKDVLKKFGRQGLQMGYEIIIAISDDMHTKLLSNFRQFNWKDTIELQNLFQSESLESKYGKFIDQRYIDFLYRNQEKLHEMNWRKFEGLTAEYFDREGYKVEIGPGRDDGGIDVRIWKEGTSDKDPPLILVQCKRYRNKIDKTVVKSLWADVQWEQADSGLIVTTSSLSPGAEKDCAARGYNIRQVDKSIIKSWLNEMKSPGAGIIMGL